jgi:hypothetical protein
MNELQGEERKCAGKMMMTFSMKRKLPFPILARNFFFHSEANFLSMLASFPSHPS